MTDQDKIEMLLKALAPFADLLEEPENCPDQMELFVASSDIAAAQIVMKACS